MLKTIRDMAVGAIVSAVIGLAGYGIAAVGTPPIIGPALQDGTWLNGLASGQNFSYQYGITAHAGGTQAAATALTPGSYLYQVGTVASNNDSVYVPQCVQGTAFLLANAGASTLYVYGNPTTNALTGAADTINATAGSTAYQMTTNTNAVFFCAKNGAWTAIKGS